MKSVLRLPHVLHFVWNHPLSKKRRLARIGRFFAWQVGARLVPWPIAVPFVNETRLLVQPGMYGATGNVYTGLHEFREMAFVLHALRADDLFVDVGANVGAYTLLAAGAVGCRCITVEPVRQTFARLLDNLRINQLESLVEPHLLAIGDVSGNVHVTDGADTMDRVVTAAELGGGLKTTCVAMKTLDELVGDRQPTIIKIDVEGFEQQVLAGGQRTLKNPSLLATIVETDRPGVEGGNGWKRLCSVLCKLGFSPCEYDVHERRLQPAGSGGSGANTIFVRSLEPLVDRVRAAPRFRVIDTAV